MNPPRRRRQPNSPSQPTKPAAPGQPNLPRPGAAPSPPNVPTPRPNVPPSAPRPNAPAPSQGALPAPIEAQVINQASDFSDLDPGPPDLKIAIFAETGFGEIDEGVSDMIEDADLVVSLGHVDLPSLARIIPSGKPSLCVYGPDDRSTQPPPPFRWLHGNGVTFKDWRIAGFSGAPRVSAAPGFYVSEDEARAIISRMPACDILLSYAPPTGLKDSPPGSKPFTALEDYIVRQMPFYSLFARSDNVSAEDLDATLVVGLNDWIMPPPFVYG